MENLKRKELRRGKRTFISGARGGCPKEYRGIYLVLCEVLHNELMSMYVRIFGMKVCMDVLGLLCVCMCMSMYMRILGTYMYTSG